MAEADAGRMRDSILKEIGSIGTAHAATALERMTGHQIGVKPTVMYEVPLAEVFRIFSGTPEMQVGIYRRMQEGLNGCLVFFVPKGQSYEFVDLISELPENTTTVLGDTEQSVLRESGGIVCASYVNAIAAMTRTTIRLTVPKLIFDQKGQVLEAILEGLFSPDTTAVVIENDFSVTDRSVKGYFLLVPEPGELLKLVELMEATL